MNPASESQPEPDALRVDFILQPHFSLLAFTAAADALTTANLVNGRKLFGFRTIALGQTKVISDLGIAIPVDCVVDEPMPEPEQEGTRTAHVMDSDSDHSGSCVVLVCGGYRCALQEDPALSRWLRHRDRQGCQLGGLWNGILAVAHAGLMQGYACALHPDNQAHARKKHRALLVRSDTLVLDRNRLSAAGPNSAFDLMLLLIRRHDCADTVQAIRNILKADTAASRTGDLAEYDSQQEQLPGSLCNALQLMRSNLDEPVSKQELAQHINLSTRAMERLFQRHLKTSPARYYLYLRLQRAHELLLQGDLPVGEISDACGFISTAHFSRCFSRCYGMAPSEVRRSVAAMLVT